MNHPFTPPGGFGFGPHERRALHERRHEARRSRWAGDNAPGAFRESLRDHDSAPGGPFGSGFPAGFPAGFGRGFGGPGFGFGPGGRRGGRRGRGRGRRGDVRAAILVLLADRPMHGYEMIQEIAERSDGLWKPSPGSVYPTLQLLVDEGLIVGAESEGSKRLFELTEEGRAAAEKVETPPWDEITEGADPNQVNLRSALGQLFGAVALSAHTATAEQQQRIVDIVNNARREIYSILGESE